MALLCAQVGEFDASARGTLVHQHRSTISQRSFVQSGQFSLEFSKSKNTTIQKFRVIDQIQSWGLSS